MLHNTLHDEWVVLSSCVVQIRDKSAKVLSMLVDINEEIVLRLWSAGSFYLISDHLFFQNTSTECFQKLLERWLLLKILLISVLEKCQSQKIVVGASAPPSPPNPLFPYSHVKCKRTKICPMARICKPRSPANQ